MRSAVLLVTFVLCCSMVFAEDESNVNFDITFDFSKVTTFAIRPGRIDSQKPELNNRLFLQKVDEAIRAALVAKRLKERSRTVPTFSWPSASRSRTTASSVVNAQRGFPMAREEAAYGAR